jgi:hypothetical protein
VFLVVLLRTVVAVDVAVGIGSGGEALQLVSFGIRSLVM